MKVSSHETLKPVEPFNPFVLRLEIETLKEAQVFHNIFNYGSLCRYIEDETDMTGGEVRTVIEKAIPDFPLAGDWGNFVKYFR